MNESTQQRDEAEMPLQALVTYREIFGAQATPTLVVYDRAGYATATLNALAREGVKAIGIQPKGRGRGALPKPSATRSEASAARPKGSLAH